LNYLLQRHREQKVLARLQCAAEFLRQDRGKGRCADFDAAAPELTFQRLEREADFQIRRQLRSAGDENVRRAALENCRRTELDLWAIRGRLQRDGRLNLVSLSRLLCGNRGRRPAGSTANLLHQFLQREADGDILLGAQICAEDIGKLRRQAREGHRRATAGDIGREVVDAETQLALRIVHPRQKAARRDPREHVAERNRDLIRLRHRFLLLGRRRSGTLRRRWRLDRGKPGRRSEKWRLPRRKKRRRPNG
jgi:hypothetical protein